MSVTQVGAIYATVSKLLQRIYIPDATDGEIYQQQITAGETLLPVPISVYRAGGVPAVQALIGVPTFSGRCAIVDLTNKVIDHVTADPALYTSPNGQVIASDVTMIGDHWTGSSFTRVFLELDHVTGRVAAISTLPIVSPTPTLNALNILIPINVAPSAIVGSTIPNVTAKIVAGKL